MTEVRRWWPLGTTSSTSLADGSDPSRSEAGGAGAEPWPARERTSDAAQTEELGARLAELLRPGDVVLISGDLGAGKTTLIRGACRALGVAEPITSPSFTIGQRYRGRVRVSHLDLFRLGAAGGGEADPAAAEVPGLLDEYADPPAILFAEWPEAAMPLLPAPPLEGGRIVRVRIAHEGGDRRSIEVEGPGEGAAQAGEER